MNWVSKHNYGHELIMKGNSYIFLQLISLDGSIIISLKDTLQLTVPCSLSAFLKSWKIAEAKGIFPHGYVFDSDIIFSS